MFTSTFVRSLTLPLIAILAALVVLLAIVPRVHADTGSGSAVLVDAGSSSASAPAPAASPLDELSTLKAKYDALREAQKGKSPTLLLWAGLIAAALKLALSLFSRYVARETKSWTKWVALGAAVPIALLSYYAGGTSLFDALVLAGAGPGAIIVHELLKRSEK